MGKEIVLDFQGEITNIKRRLDKLEKQVELNTQRIDRVEAASYHFQFNLEQIERRTSESLTLTDNQSARLHTTFMRLSLVAIGGWIAIILGILGIIFQPYFTEVAKILQPKAAITQQPLPQTPAADPPPSVD